MKRTKKLLPNRHIYEEGKIYFCECGCEKHIELKIEDCKRRGVPRYILGHHNTGKKKVDLELIGTNLKTCSKCKNIKETSEFYKDKSQIDGIRPWCVSCISRNAKRYRQDNLEVCKMRSTKWAMDNSERERELNREWNLKNPEKAKEKELKYRKSNPEKIKDRRLKYLYGITLIQYQELLKNQNYCCAICKRHEKELVDKRELTEKRNKLFVDHDHNTGYVRGLLCDRCNKLLGYAKDTQEILVNASKYLDTFSIGEKSNGL